MDINRATLDALFTGFKKLFQIGTTKFPPTWDKIATMVPSSTSQNAYPWLGDIPGLREWIGDRQVKKFGAHDYAIKNRKFEQTIGVKGDTISDDQFGVYSPMFTAMGEAASLWPDEIVYSALRDGFITKCYDGQYFFDTDHPSYNANGDESGTVSNYQAGAGAPWVLMNTRKALKPLIWQLREAPSKLVSMDREDDLNVFNRDEFLYGTKGRGNAGYGFWQMAYASKATLDEANFKAARLAMRSLKDELGRPVVNEPNLLVVGTANADAAEEILKKDRKANGETNTLQGAVELLVTPYLF